MRTINHIIIHCSATREGHTLSPAALEACHKARGWRTTGYHYYITRDGVIHCCRREDEPGAHARGYNADSIGICYEGGLDREGHPADTRTPSQRAALHALLYNLHRDYPEADILGHRDLPGVKKSCPCFDALHEYKLL